MYQTENIFCHSFPVVSRNGLRFSDSEENGFMASGSVGGLRINMGYVAIINAILLRMTGQC